MHLCGVDYRKGAGSFFDDCLNRHVIIDELKIKKDGTTMQKLQVLGSIEKACSSNWFRTLFVFGV